MNKFKNHFFLSKAFLSFFISCFLAIFQMSQASAAGHFELAYKAAQVPNLDYCTVGTNPLSREVVYQKTDITGPLPYTRIYQSALGENVNRALDMVLPLRSTGGWVDNYHNYIIVRDEGPRKNRLVARVRLPGDSEDSHYVGQMNGDNITLKSFVRIYSPNPLAHEAGLVQYNNGNYGGYDPIGTSSTNKRDRILLVDGLSTNPLVMASTPNISSLVNREILLVKHGYTYRFKYIKSSSSREAIFKLLSMQTEGGNSIGFAYDSHGGLRSVADKRGNYLDIERSYDDPVDVSNSVVKRVTLNADGKTSPLTNNAYAKNFSNTALGNYYQEAVYNYAAYDWTDFRPGVTPANRKIYVITDANSTLNGYESYEYTRGALVNFMVNGEGQWEDRNRIPLLEVIKNNQFQEIMRWTYTDNVYSGYNWYRYLKYVHQGGSLKINDAYLFGRGGQLGVGDQATSLNYGVEYLSNPQVAGFTPFHYNVRSEPRRNPIVRYSFSGYRCATYNGVPVKDMVVNANYGYVESITDQRNHSTTFTYDDRNRLLTVREATGTPQERLTTYTYTTYTNGSTNTSAIPNTITKPGLTVSNEISPNRWIMSQTIGSDQPGSSQRTTTYTYVTSSSSPLFGKLLKVDGSRTDVDDSTSFTYDTKGNLLTKTVMVNGVGKVTTYSGYTDLGAPTTIVHPTGVTEEFSYSVAGVVKTHTKKPSRALGANQVTQYTYSAINGQVIMAMHPDLVMETYAYDILGRNTEHFSTNGVFTQKTYFDDNSVKTEYSHFGAKNSSTGAATSVTKTYGLNNQGFIAFEQVGQGSANRVTHVYDPNGNLASSTTAQGVTNTFTYDALNRKASHTDGEAKTTTYTYDLVDNIKTVTNPLGQQTGYSYINGKMHSNSNGVPDIRRSTYYVDEHISSYEQGNNFCNKYGINSIGQATRLMCHDLMLVTDRYVEDRYAYDQHFYESLSSVTGDNSSLKQAETGYEYDGHGRIARKLQTNRKPVDFGFNPSVQALSYQYNTVNDLVGMTLPSGRQINYQYSSSGQRQLAQISLQSQPLVRAIVYGRNGAVTDWSWGSSGSAGYKRSINASNQVTNIENRNSSGQLNYNAVYGHDLDSRITSLNVNGAAYTYGYDRKSQLTSETMPGYTIRYVYDDNGNRLSRTGRWNATYGYSDGRLTSLTQGSTPHVITDTGNSNKELQHRNLSDAVYDHRGRRLHEIPVTTPVVGLQKTAMWMGYNHNNERTLRMVPQQGNSAFARQFVYDEASHLIGEYSLTGTPLVEYVWMGDTPVAAIYGGVTSTKIYYIVTDHNNTPRRLIDAATDQVVWSWDSDAFGFLKPTGTVTFNLRFPGQYFDDRSGLHYNHNRYYYPDVGRYIEVDPLGLEAGLNPYIYANNNPVMNVDPSGLIAPVVYYGGAALVHVARAAAPHVGRFVYTNAHRVGAFIEGLSPAAAGSVGAGGAVAATAKMEGGAYRQVKGVTGNEAHHAPANSISPLTKGDGPAISMTKADHRRTASWGRSNEAAAYRAEQKQLIEQGRFREAQQKDIDDVQAKFGSQYDNALYQMKLYTMDGGF